MNTKTVTLRWGVLGFHGLRVWPILTLGFRNLRLNRTGFRVLRCDTGCEFGQFLASGFGYFIQDSYFFRFSNRYSPCRQLRSENSFRMLTIRPRESLKKTEMLKIIENYC